VGSTPVEYRNARRIVVAQRLLIDDAEAVNTIAAR